MTCRRCWPASSTLEAAADLSPTAVEVSTVVKDEGLAVRAALTVPPLAS